MKQLTIFLVFIFFLSCKKEAEVFDSYSINVEAPGVYNGMRAYLKTLDERGRLIDMDTAIVIDEKFSFKGKQEEPTIQYLFVNGSENFLPIIIENGKINVTINKDSIQTSTIEGTVNNEVYKAYLLKENEIKNKIVKITDTFKRASSAEKQAIYQRLNALQEELNNLTLNHIKEKSDSYVSVLLFNQSLKSTKWPLQEVETVYSALSDNLKSTAQGQNISNYIISQKQSLEAQKATEIGSVAPNFSAPTPQGDLLALNDIKGKVTIIDFWASWCGPCRRENPNVVNVYNKYHDKGLEIISVSLDRQSQKDRWLKAIEDDKLNWHHVSNLQFWQDPIAKMYNVRSIPATFILDKDGNIVAKNLRGQALGDKIAALLK